MLMDGRISKAVGQGMHPHIFSSSNIANLKILTNVLRFRHGLRIAGPSNSYLTMRTSDKHLQWRDSPEDLKILHIEAFFLNWEIIILFVS